jgi:hypothetical protein
VIERNAITVPTAVVEGVCWRDFASAAITDSIGSGWDAAAATADWIALYFHIPRITAPPTMMASSTADDFKWRLFMGEVLEQREPVRVEQVRGPLYS